MDGEFSLQRITKVAAPPSRMEEGHKGSFGRALLVAGSVGMAGAAGLAGQAALHGGAGLVSVAVPASILPTVAGYHPAYMTIPLDETQRASNLSEQILALCEGMQAVGIGPGLGSDSKPTQLARDVYARCPIPLVLDADGLNAFQQEPGLLAQHIGPRILTPHPGEFSRLTGKSIPEITGNREELAAEFARRWNVIVLLKGPGTVITDGMQLAINTTGNSALATGGSGDILTGLIVALLAQGMPPLEAAQFGAHLHGLAGELAGQEFAPHFVTAVEILSSLSSAWKQVTSSN